MKKNMVEIWIDATVFIYLLRRIQLFKHHKKILNNQRQHRGTQFLRYAFM